MSVTTDRNCKFEKEKKHFIQVFFILAKKNRLRFQRVNEKKTVN
jgi:hypothetical protein